MSSPRSARPRNLPSQRTRVWVGAMVALALAGGVVACAPGLGGDPATEPPPATDRSGDTARPSGGGGNQPAPDHPDQPIGGPLQPPGQTEPGDGALRVEPEAGIVDPRPHAWDHIDVAADGKTLTVYYWGGVEDCYGLAGVDVGRNADGLLDITVFEGRRGDLPPDTACIEIALLKSVVVTLDEPLLAPAE